MIKFLKKLAIFCFILFIVDRGAGWVLSKLYFSQSKGKYVITTYAIDSTKADILIFGSSRGVRAYSSEIMEDSLGLSCYNMSRVGQQIPFHAAILTPVTERYTPKLIVLDINAWEFDYRPSRYERLNALLPYCKKHPSLINYIKISDPYIKYKMLSASYPFNSTLVLGAYHHLMAKKIPSDNKGFDPLDINMDSAQIEFTKRSINTIIAKNEADAHVIDTVCAALFEGFIKTCIDKKIKLYVVFSPNLWKERDVVRKNFILSTVAKYPTITLLDYTEDARFVEKYEFFADNLHLNLKGATKFTQIFAHDLSKEVSTRLKK